MAFFESCGSLGISSSLISSSICAVSYTHLSSGQLEGSSFDRFRECHMAVLRIDDKSRGGDEVAGTPALDIAAVSYTHLDVYKRQRHTTEAPASLLPSP